MARGIHSKPNTGATQEWMTPPDLIEKLGPFDLDPCGHPNQSLEKYTPGGTPWFRSFERIICPPEDGLSAEWKGRVWLNPPYGSKSSRLWMEKMASHGHGTALVASRTEVESWWIPFVWGRATAVLFLRGRLHYWTPNGKRASGNAGHGSALIAYGREDAGLLLLSEIEGQFVWLGNENKPATEQANGDVR